MSARVLITGGRAVVSFPYSAYVVERLKAEVPPPCREYDPARKLWTIYPPYIGPAVAIIRSAYPDAEIEDAAAPTITPPAIDPDFAELHLLPTAPPELIDVAYRTLARIHHPDAGGDTRVMQRLNAARDAIARRAS